MWRERRRGQEEKRRLGQEEGALWMEKAFGHLIQEYGKEEYFTDSSGKLYTERPVVSKIGFPVGKMTFRVSEREPGPLLMAAVFGGFLGIHRFAVGEMRKGIVYAVSAGGFGVLVLMDILEILGGRFSYLETVYGEKDGEIFRQQERLYVRRPEVSVAWRVGAVFLGMGISMVLFFTVYKMGYRAVFGVLGNFASQAMKGLLGQ